MQRFRNRYTHPSNRKGPLMEGRSEYMQACAEHDDIALFGDWDYVFMYDAGGPL